MILPMKIHVLIVSLFFMLAFGGNYYYNTSSHMREQHPTAVTLVEAYSTTLNVGKSNTKEVFRGRFFHKESNLLLDRSIDGFYYHRFIDGGKNPLSGTLELSRVELGEKEPRFTTDALVLEAVGFIMGSLYLLIGLLGGFRDYREYQY